MDNSLLTKILVAFTYLFNKPGESFSWLRRGNLLKDRDIIRHSYWILGEALRVPLTEIIENSRVTNILIPRAFDRDFRTSITISEACAIASIVRTKNVKSVLEIGTYDGNTTLLLATNSSTDCKIVTVDLPPDFNEQKAMELNSKDSINNLTPRNILATQYKNTEYETKIRQIYGDSTKLAWSTFDGPFDLIFIDACHKKSYVESDTRNALANLKPGGIILWHDYGEIPDVTLVVDEFMKDRPDLRIKVIEGTRIAIGILN